MFGTLALLPGKQHPPRTLYRLHWALLPDRVRALTSSAAWANEVDIDRAREQLRHATDTLARQERDNNVEQAQAAVAQARAQLEAYERGR